MSFDYRLMFGLDGLAMVMFIAGQFLPISFELAVLGGGCVAAVGLSLANRHLRGWRWPGAGPKQWLRALLYLLPFGIVAFVAEQSFPPYEPFALPWYFAIANFAVFWTLSNLRIARMSRARFEADPQGLELTPAARIEHLPLWKRRVKRVYQIVFVAVWLEGMAFFYVDGRQMNSGSTNPTTLQTSPLTEHGRTVYVTAQNSELVSWLMTGFMVGVPLVLLSGFALQFLFGVPLWSNLPAGWKAWKRNT